MSIEAADPRDAIEDRSIRPVVAMPRAGLSGMAITGLCLMLGLMLFLVLDGRRRGDSGGSGRPLGPIAITSPDPLGVPLPPPPALLPTQVVSPNQPSSTVPNGPMPASQPQVAGPSVPPPLADLPPSTSPQTGPVAPPRARDDKSSPLLIDLTVGDKPEAAEGKEASDDQAIRATIIRNRSSLVPQGSMIKAVLETPIDSRRPGLVRAIVSRDARGFDGSRVLIPRGSRLIGEASGDAGPGQRRILVSWTRLIRPDGVAIRIGSPAADVLGGAGIQGRTNTHFIERFGNAVLQTALMVGVNLASRPRSGSVVVGVPGQLGMSAQNILPEPPKGPTIKVASGKEISVFVAKDLDFSGVGTR